MHYEEEHEEGKCAGALYNSQGQERRPIQYQEYEQATGGQGDQESY